MDFWNTSYLFADKDFDGTPGVIRTGKVLSAQFDLEVHLWQKAKILNGKNHGGMNI